MHDNIPNYVATYAKAYTCVPIKRGKRVGCQEIRVKTKGKYLIAAEEVLVC